MNGQDERKVRMDKVRIDIWAKVNHSKGNRKVTS